MTVALDELLTAAQTAINKQAGTSAITSLTASSRAAGSGGARSGTGLLGLPGAAVGGSDVAWVFGAMMKLKESLLDSDRCGAACCVRSPLSDIHNHPWLRLYNLGRGPPDWEPG